MTSIAISDAAPSPRAGVSPSVLVGRILSGLAIAFLTFDGAIKLFPIKAVIESSAQLGYRTETIAMIGIVLLTCVLLYAIPRTAVLGALLLTGYLGGAVATHVRPPR